MGDIVRVECSECAKSAELFVGCGMQETCTQEAFCFDCDDFRAVVTSQGPQQLGFRCSHDRSHTVWEFLDDITASESTPDTPFRGFCETCNEVRLVYWRDVVLPTTLEPVCSQNRTHRIVTLDFEQDKRCPRCQKVDLTVQECGVWD